MSLGDGIQEVTDGDVEWAIQTLGLDDLDEPRREFLKAQRTLDVSAAPGSGKTTLLVAKIAILARTWRYESCGICVLSHTNAARTEIEHRLGGTPVGHRLLAYPHFIGTIHAWASRFLGMPSLHSKGNKVAAVDNSLAGRARLRALGQARDRVNKAIQNPTMSAADIRFHIPDENVYLGAVPFPTKDTTWSYKQAKRAVEKSFEWGYYRHDEMFEFALDLLAQRPELPRRIARRFPIVLIDEIQDTSSDQDKLIRLAFEETRTPIVQRIGDPNQAIFDTISSSSRNSSSFPDASRERIELPNSYRFGPLIARAAQGFAAQGLPSSGLHGDGPREWAGLEELTEQPPTIIVFPNENPQSALERFGQVLLDTVPDDRLLRSTRITAVGHYHQLEPAITVGDPKFPKSVSHYWHGYRPISAPRPSSFEYLAGHFLHARATALRDGAAQEAVNIAAHGLVELARIVNPSTQFARSTRAYHAIQAHLANSPEALAGFQKLCHDILGPRSNICIHTWPTWVERAITVGSSLVGSVAVLSQDDPFLAWPEDLLESSGPDTAELGRATNAFRVQQGARYVDIQLGSIHSVKGQTHLATLVLSTHWYKHFFQKLMPWLTGQNEYYHGEGPQNLQRLLLAYVAMTRPTHLLALAIPRSTTVAVGGNEAGMRSRLEALGWRMLNAIE